jgi:hypothetical protein
MIEEIRWRLSVSRNTTLHGWMREQYALDELKRLEVEAADADLIHVYNPLADTYLGGGLPMLRKTVQRLYQAYGDQIWSACYRAAERDRPSNGYDLYTSWLAAFDSLPMSRQVIKPRMFEEFLVRHALAQCAKEILREDAQTERSADSSPSEF